MSFPSVATTSGFSLASAGTSTTMGYSVNPAAGQLIINGVRWAGAPGTVTFTGYTQFATDSSDASDDTSTLYYRWADGTEGSTDPISWVNSVKACAAGYVIDAAANPAGQVPQTSTVAIGTGSNPNPTTATPTGGAKDYLWIVWAGMDGENTFTAAPTSYTPAGSEGNNSGTGGAAASNCVVATAWRQMNAASEDPGAYTSGAANAGWTAWTIAIHPPAAGSLELGPVLTLQAVNRSSVY